MAGQLGENGNMHKYPLAIVAGVGLLILISFSDKYQEKRKNNKFLDLVARYGNLFPYLIAMVVGLLVGELDAPGLEIGTFIKIPQFKDIIDQVSIFGVGIPPASMFIKALPLALVCYVIAFGDFVTTETLVSEARQALSLIHIDVYKRQIQVHRKTPFSDKYFISDYILCAGFISQVKHIILP